MPSRLKLDFMKIRRAAAALTLLVLSCIASPALAIDRVYPMNSATAVSGELTATGRAGVSVKGGGATQDLPADQIKKILFEGDPAPLTNGREFALDGQYDQALPLLQSVDLSAIKRDIVKADVLYYQVLCMSELALAGKGDKGAAAKAALDFVSKNPESWHFFSAAKLLGDLALAMKNYDAALKYYGSLRSAPSVESKIQAVYLTGATYLAKGDTELAIAEFDKVAGVSVQSVDAAKLQKLAKAGKAVGLARTGKAKEGLELVKTLIQDLNATDVEVAAKIYNAQGASFEAAEDVEGAILAYLHTHLMFSSQASEHAEALTKLIQLWPKVGKPERAAEAKQELQQRYPGLAG
jgi:tetratricopeptide (TPR) repeat protein